MGCLKEKHHLQGCEAATECLRKVIDWSVFIRRIRHSDVAKGWRLMNSVQVGSVLIAGLWKEYCLNLCPYLKSEAGYICTWFCVYNDAVETIYTEIFIIKGKCIHIWVFTRVDFFSNTNWANSFLHVNSNVDSLNAIAHSRWSPATNLVK